MRKIFGVLLLIVGAAWAVLGLMVSVGYFEAQMFCIDMTSVVLYLVIALILFGGVSGICIFLGIRLLKKKKAKKQKAVRHKLEHFTSEGLEVRSYESAVVSKIRNFLESWIASSMAVLLALMAIDGIGSYFMPIELYAIENFWFYIWLTGFAIAVFRVAYWCNIRIEICRKGVIFYRANRAYKCYPIEANYRLHVKRNYYKGIPTRPNLQMYIGLDENDIRVEKCHCISMDDFAAMQWDIDKIKKDGRFGRTEQSDIAVEVMFAGKESIDFIIPKENMLGSEKKRMIQIICACFCLGIVLLLLWGAFAMKQEAAMGMIPMTAAMCFMPGFMVAVIQGIRYVIYAKRLPDKIQLTPGYIAIGEEKIFWAELGYVMMTTPEGATKQSHVFGRRRMILHHGTHKSTYPIGNIPGVLSKTVYAEYENLMQAIQKCCNQRQIPFREM